MGLTDMIEQLKELSGKVNLKRLLNNLEKRIVHSPNELEIQSILMCQLQNFYLKAK
jgi:hypothetical protein